MQMPFDMKRLGAAALAASLVLASGEAFAQAQPKPDIRLSQASTAARDASGTMRILRSPAA